MSTVKIITGVLAGLTVGALLGVLFAPEKGSDTRKKIAGKGKDTLDELKEKFNELADGLNDRLMAAKEEAVKMGKNNL